MKLAAIDIGSNSIKLVIVDAVASDSFAVLARQKESVRLGRQTLREGFLSASAIESAAECIKQFRSMAEARGAEHLFAIATAAVREAANATQFIKEIKQQTGVRVEILSGIEEARLIGLAAAHGCGVGRDASLINIDIGGGSTEISLVRDGISLALYSIKVGAVGLSELFLNSNPPKPKEVKALREEIRAALERPSRELREAKWQIATGTSGTGGTDSDSISRRRSMITPSRKAHEQVRKFFKLRARITPSRIWPPATIISARCALMPG